MEDVKIVYPEKLEKMLEDLPKGTFRLLDVRQPAEYEEQHIPGAELIPLPDLPDRLHELEKNVPWIVYCRTGRRSELAARILMSEGFADVSNLAGGITAWDHGVAKGDIHQGMFVFSALQDIADLLLVSYGMERELQKFYAMFEKSASDPDLKKALNKLAFFEESHMKALGYSYLELTGRELDDAMVDEVAMPGVLEGGFRDEAVTGIINEAVENKLALFEIALAVEAQAYDLYMRASRQIENKKIALLCLTMAQSEGYHMKIVGRLLDSHFKQYNSP